MTKKPGIVCNVRLAVTEDGVVITEKTERSHSFVNNFAALLLRSIDGVSNTDYRDVLNAAQKAALWTRYYTAQCTAGMNVLKLRGYSPPAVYNNGIIIGTSNVAFSVSQYSLGAVIQHGSGSGQMVYTTMPTPSDPAYTAPDILLMISRDFTNNSGASITVREIGFMGSTAMSDQQVASVLFARDVVGDTVVTNGQVLNVQYIFKTVV